jgi:cyclase
MTKCALTVFSIVIILACAVVGFAQQNPPAPLPLTIEKVAQDLYVVRGEAGNTTVLVTDEGVVVVDVKFDRNYDDLMAKVRSVTDKPIKYVINTHSHGDHTGGNPKFPSSVTIIAHRNARAAMIQGKQPGPPQITYTDQFVLNLGGKEVVGRYFGRAHTDGDTWVSFPLLRVLSSGDSFTTANGQGLNPTHSPTYGFIIAPGGSFAEITGTLDNVLKEDFDTVIPGHGSVGTKADVVKWRNEIEKLRNRMTEMVRGGKTKEDIQKMLVSEFGWDPMGNPLRNVDNLINELKR